MPGMEDLNEAMKKRSLRTIRTVGQPRVAESLAVKC